MKILLLTAWYFPHSVGGTEWYVRWLARDLTRLGVDVVIATPADDASPGSEHRIDGVPVVSYQVTPRPAPRDLYSSKLARADRESFELMMDHVKPDLVHVHSYTRGVGSGHLSACREKGIPVVVTVHLPDLLCARGTMMLYGREACDGKFDASRCTDCSLEPKGVPWVIRQVIRRNSIPFVPHKLPLVRTLFHRARLEQRIALTRAYLGHADRIVVVAEWLRDVLLSNGISDAKISVSRHGLGDVPKSTGARGQQQDEFVVGYLGRINPVKGIDLLINALRELSSEFRLVIAGAANSADEREHEARLRRLAGPDPRVSWPGALTSDEEKESFFRSIDVLAVPSNCLETGPLVVLEAFAHGRPVIGVRAGGIAETVAHGSSGLLVAGHGLEDWKAALEEAKARRPSPWTIPTPRSSGDVASEMHTIYEALLESSDGSIPGHRGAV